MTPSSSVGIEAIRTMFLPIARARNEMAVVAYLDRDQRLLAMRHVTGGRDWLALSIRTVVIDAIVFGADAAMLAHNHPSGDCKPSRSDYAYTRRLARALDGLHVTLLDHVVLAADGHISLRETGYL